MMLDLQLFDRARGFSDMRRQGFGRGGIGDGALLRLTP
jgi:hypothetical protein